MKFIFTNPDIPAPDNTYVCFGPSDTVRQRIEEDARDGLDFDVEFVTDEEMSFDLPKNNVQLQYTFPANTRVKLVFYEGSLDEMDVEPVPDTSICPITVTCTHTMHPDTVRNIVRAAMMKALNSLAGDLADGWDRAKLVSPWSFLQYKGGPFIAPLFRLYEPVGARTGRVAYFMSNMPEKVLPLGPYDRRFLMAPQGPVDVPLDGLSTGASNAVEARKHLGLTTELLSTDFLEKAREAVAATRAKAIEEFQAHLDPADFEELLPIDMDNLEGSTGPVEDYAPDQLIFNYPECGVVMLVTNPLFSAKYIGPIKDPANYTSHVIINRAVGSEELNVIEIPNGWDSVEFCYDDDDYTGGDDQED